MLYFLLVLLGISLIIELLPKKKYSPNDFLAAIIDKHTILEQHSAPKIVLVGGSNIAFGVDSQLLSDSLHKPVINMGLNAALGLDFMLKEVAQQLKPQDIVIVSPEYFLTVDGYYKYKKKAGEIYPTATSFFLQNPKNEIDIYLENRQNIFKALFNKTKPTIDENEKTVYSRKSFDSKGDITAHLVLEKRKILTDRSQLEYKYWQGIALLNKFNSEMKSKKVKVYFCYPSYAKTEYLRNKIAINKLKKDINEDLELPILGSLNNFLFADSLFFDTIYHLGKNGRQQRTQKMLAFLKKQLLKNKQLLH